MPIYDTDGKVIANTLTTKKHDDYYKQNIYAQTRLKGASMSAAAIKAGVPPSSARRAGMELERKPQVQRTFKEALENAGVTSTLLARKLREGLDADKPHPNGVDTITDYGERRQYAKLVLEATGELKTGTTVAVQINLPTDFLAPWGEE